MLGRTVGKAAAGDWPGVLAGIAGWTSGANAAVVNLESPLTRQPHAGNGLDLRADPAAVAALTVAGVDFVGVANNHALDGGSKGLAESETILRAAGLTPLDGKSVRLSARPPVYAVALCDCGGEPDLAPARAAARLGFLVAFVHWGVEYSPVTARQRRLAGELVAAGADLIVGHGPHVLQPVERVGGVPVAFSLGNLVFDGAMPATHEGALLAVDYDGREARLSAVPTEISRHRARAASGEKARAILARLNLPAAVPR